MFNSPIIEVKNISKKYNIVHQRGGYVAMRDILTDIAKHPFKFLKTKTKQAMGRETKEIFWALKDINFEIQKGEAVGIIGHNGSGKSTLLKILTGITPPATGEIRMHGKVASLLEVGTGFHPELTGRENIFLNGAILGMSKKEIAEKFDAIVEFSGVQKFIDTPVKRYSSGMAVRLGFSVAAHMEPDILLVDEVLAVGDAEFQKKCLGKMDEVTKEQNRTILFVSHNMSAVQKLCKKCILLEEGKIKMIGDTKDVINYYLMKKNKESNKSIFEYSVAEDKDVQITKISILNKDNKSTSQIPISEKFSILINYRFLKDVKNALLVLMFFSDNEILLHSSEGDSTGELTDYKKGDYSTKIEIPSFLFNNGLYNLDVSIQHPGVKFIDRKNNITINIIDINNPRFAIFRNSSPGKISSILSFETIKN